LGMYMHAVPVSRFTRRQSALADTSNECGNSTRSRRESKNIQPRARGMCWRRPDRLPLRVPSGEMLTVLKFCSESEE
jgi:hypothetical protein